MRTTFTMENQNITMTRGDTLSFGLLIEGTQDDLDTAYFTCKKNYDDSPIFTKSLNNGITKQDVGEYAVRLDPQDTNNVEIGKYIYDLQISIGNDVFTILKGILEIENEIGGANG